MLESIGGIPNWMHCTDGIPNWMLMLESTGGIPNWILIFFCFDIYYKIVSYG